jgi:hypothetical protein
MKEIVESGELGTLTKVEANLTFPAGVFKDTDIRMVYNLGGGAMMDAGCESSIAVSCEYHRATSRRLYLVHLPISYRCRSYEDHQCQGRCTSKVPYD